MLARLDGHRDLGIGRQVAELGGEDAALRLPDPGVYGSRAFEEPQLVDLANLELRQLLEVNEGQTIGPELDGAGLDSRHAARARELVSLDLLGRKILLDNGAKLKKFGAQVQAFIEDNGTDEALSEFISPLADPENDTADPSLAVWSTPAFADGTDVLAA